jgi:hypothetical protein
MNKDLFLTKTFQKLKYIPSTKLGYFDATFRPETQKLAIEIRYDVTFSNANLVWTIEVQDTFKKEFTNRIPEYWNNRFVITCKKAGWRDIVAVPEFSLREASNRHFSIKAAGTMGTRNTAVRPFGTGHDRMANSVDHATAIFGSQAADRMANADFQLGQIKDALRQPFVVPFGDAAKGGQLSFAAMSHLQSFANNVVHAFVRTPTKPKIKLTALGSRSSGATDRVKTVLHHFGVQNTIETSRDSIFGSKQASGVKVQWANLAEYDSMFPTETKAVPLFSQATIVHEFGHMLGLPDEYNVLCSESVNPLVSHKMVREDAEGQRFLDYNLKRDAASSGAISENQRVFMQLCGEAGLVPPPFGRPNMNVMSGGSRFEPHHCITVWDCLCDMTRGIINKNEWEIRMAV